MSFPLLVVVSMVAMRQAPKADAFFVQRRNDVVKIARAACQSIQSGHDERVAAPHEVESFSKCRSIIRTSARPLLGENLLATSSEERLLLNDQILILSANATVTDKHSGVPFELKT